MTQYAIYLIRKNSTEGTIPFHKIDASTIQIRDGVYIFHGRGSETVAAFPIREYYVKVES